MILKHQIYHGIQNREQLEIICGDLLPKKAKVWFAYYQQHKKMAPNEYKYGLVCYYEFEKRFYGIMCGRVIIGGEALPWKREGFMFNQDNNDSRWRLETELARAKEAMDKIREKPGNEEKTSIFEDVLTRMIEREKEWQAQ